GGGVRGGRRGTGGEGGETGEVGPGAGAIRAGDDAPGGAVPVFGERLEHGASAGGDLEVPDRPDVAGGDGGDTGEVVVPRAVVGTGHYCPILAVPVLDESLGYQAGNDRPDGPDIIAGDGGHPGNAARGGGTFRNGPLAAVPVHELGGVTTAGQQEATAGPDIGAGDGRHPGQGAGYDGGGRHDALSGAVPMLGQQLVVAQGVLG